MKEITAIDIHAITVFYNNIPAIEDITLSIPQGLLVGIVGPNGAGKSTLLKTIIGLMPATSGSIELLGQPFSKIYKKIAYVPQRTTVDWDFPINVFDVVMMGRYAHLGWLKKPSAHDQKIVIDALEKVGMIDLKDRHISQLSGGQQQRIFLARALAQEADLYLLDEPFSGVDAKTELSILTILKELSDSGKTVIVVHHDLNTVNAYFNWVILLNKRLIAAGPMSSTLTTSTIEKTYGMGKIIGFGLDIHKA